MIRRKKRILLLQLLCKFLLFFCFNSFFLLLMQLTSLSRGKNVSSTCNEDEDLSLASSRGVSDDLLYSSMKMIGSKFQKDQGSQATCDDHKYDTSDDTSTKVNRCYQPVTTMLLLLKLKELMWVIIILLIFKEQLVNGPTLNNTNWEINNNNIVRVLVIVDDKTTAKVISEEINRIIDDGEQEGIIRYCSSARVEVIELSMSCGMSKGKGFFRTVAISFLFLLIHSPQFFLWWKAFWRTHFSLSLKEW